MAFFSKFGLRFGEVFFLYKFKINSKIIEALLFAILGLISSSYFSISCWPKENIFRYFGGIAFIFSFGIFFYRIYIHKNKLLFVHGFVYWIFYFIGALYWLVYPLTFNLKTHGLLIPIALVIVPAYLSIPLLIPIYFIKKYCKNVRASALWFSFLNFCVFYLEGHYAPGFPWAIPGYVWSENIYMMQSLSIWGIYGQTFITLLIGSIFGIGFYYNKKDWKKCFSSVFTAFCLLLFIYVFGFTRISKNFEECTNYKIRSIQGSILQQNKMNKKLSLSNLNFQLNLSRIESDRENWTPDFLIWPEASVPYLFTDNSVFLKQKLAEVVPVEGYLIVGVVREDSTNKKIYNSVAVLDGAGSNIVNYDKKHLVPFGEYIPFRKLIPKIFAPIANSIGDFAVGKNSNVVELKGLKMALTICYEAIFPGEFISADADAIVNITNDAWFGYTSELVQHLNIVRARAIEEGVPLIRVTNFGISAVFDAYGRKIESLEENKVGVIDCYIPKKIKKTFYRKFFVDKMRLKQ